MEKPCCYTCGFYNLTYRGYAEIILFNTIVHSRLMGVAWQEKEWYNTETISTHTLVLLETNFATVLEFQWKLPLWANDKQIVVGHRRFLREIHSDSLYSPTSEGNFGSNFCTINRRYIHEKWFEYISYIIIVLKMVNHFYLKILATIFIKFDYCISL